ncbi:hypothetical protein FUAX_07380 [Fulvitalea axinellae]|uniref:Phosphatidic acid phosphatase type 2/haloperoxidase domain-containing protein n=1 Tax=Fulvitalea axinellae TaxID=1182444 RepID=A0AAU9D643_9BACT|nr:hypothetical protein FUAX_07380 [Fulvitalea axinellae]
MRKLLLVLGILVSSFLSLRAQTSTLETDLLKEKTNAFTKKQWLFPALCITYGAIGLIQDSPVNKADQRVNSEVVSRSLAPRRFDDYLQYAPVAAVYGLNAVGIKGKSSFRKRTTVWATSMAIMGTTVGLTKKGTARLRPDGSARTSFPSGHTATAFVSAEFMRQEYWDVSPWYGIAGYAAATLTGAMRVRNNRHWVSDVVAGAGVGILSVRLAYWAYPWLERTLYGRKKRPGGRIVLPQLGVPTIASIAPFYNGRQAGLTLRIKL